MAKQSSRFEFIAEHKGGPIDKEVHRKLIRWARKCSEHVLHLIDYPIDERLTYALQICEDWAEEKVTTGIAMKASIGAHAAARESGHPVTMAVARSIGQAVATAHMADHSIGAALYALKALKSAREPLEKEKLWQREQLLDLPPEIVNLIETTLAQKGKSFKV